MPKLDHLTIAVSDWRRSRDWYVGNLGFRLEFEIPEGGRILFSYTIGGSDAAGQRATAFMESLIDNDRDITAVTPCESTRWTPSAPNWRRVELHSTRCPPNSSGVTAPCSPTRTGTSSTSMMRFRCARRAASLVGRAQFVDSLG